MADPHLLMHSPSIDDNNVERTSQQEAPAVPIWTRRDDESARDRVRLLLLDELGLFRSSLGRFLGSEGGFEIAGECGTTAEALEILSRSKVNVVLLDFAVGPEHAEDFMSAAQQAGYQGRFLILAVSADVRKSAIVLKAGASGIFLKSESPERLVQAIKLVALGEIWMDQGVLHQLADQLISRYPQIEDRPPGQPLDDRERNVLRGILGGLSNRKIGNALEISESSVKNIVQRLFGKAGVKTRSQLVRVALEGPLGIASGYLPPQMRTRSACGPLKGSRTVASLPSTHKTDEQSSD